MMNALSSKNLTAKPKKEKRSKVQVPEVLEVDSEAKPAATNSEDKPNSTPTNQKESNVHTEQNLLAPPTSKKKRKSSERAQSKSSRL